MARAISSTQTWKLFAHTPNWTKMRPLTKKQRLAKRQCPTNLEFCISATFSQIGSDGYTKKNVHFIAKSVQLILFSHIWRCLFQFSGMKIELLWFWWKILWTKAFFRHAGKCTTCTCFTVKFSADTLDELRRIFHQFHATPQFWAIDLVELFIPAMGALCCVWIDEGILSWRVNTAREVHSHG